MHQRTRMYSVWCCLLMALGVGALAPTQVLAQPPAGGDIILPVGTSISIPNSFGPNLALVEIVPPIAEAKIAIDLKSINIIAQDVGFGQVRLKDKLGNLLQAIGIQILPADLELPFGETKVFPAAPGNTVQDVKVTNPDVVKVVISPDKKQAAVTGINLGPTKLTVIDNKGGFQVFSLIVVPSEKYVQFKIRQAVPSATVYPVQINKGVFVLNGTVERAEDIPAVLETAKLINIVVVNQLHVPGVMQVQLDVVIAEVSRTELRQMEFQWFDAGKRHFLASTFAKEAAPFTALGNVGIAPASVSTALGADANLSFGFVNDKQSFLGFLTALRNEGLAKLLACPKVVTMSGKPANFLSGGKLAVPEPSGLGTNAVTYVPFGTQLNVLPIVLGNGKIFVEIEPFVDNVDAALGTVIAGTAVPGFDSQHLHTSVELEAGQTFAIGGLIQHQVEATTSKVPVLGDLPFIGTAFRSVQHNQIETELLIMVTPYLVDAMACNQLPKFVPGQETRMPDDFELFLEGILEAPRGQRDIFTDGFHYRAAYFSSPTAGTFPCGTPGANGPAVDHGWGRACGNGSCGKSCGNGNCGNGGCANGTAQAPPMIQPALPVTQTPAVIPPVPPRTATVPVSYGSESGQYPTGTDSPQANSEYVPEPPAAQISPGGEN